MEPVVRHIARVLLIDGRERVLLFDMRTADGRSFWLPPGGGVEPGEDDASAAIRELREETGWRTPVIGPLIGTRRDVVTWHDGITYDARERWFLARIDVLEVDHADWTDDERADMAGSRWWTLEELAGTDADITPADLAARVRDLLRAGPPDPPWDLSDGA